MSERGHHVAFERQPPAPKPDFTVKTEDDTAWIEGNRYPRWLPRVSTGRDRRFDDYDLTWRRK